MDNNSRIFEGVNINKIMVPVAKHPVQGGTTEQEKNKKCEEHFKTNGDCSKALRMTNGEVIQCKEKAGGWFSRTKCIFDKMAPLGKQNAPATTRRNNNNNRNNSMSCEEKCRRQCATQSGGRKKKKKGSRKYKKKHLRKTHRGGGGKKRTRKNKKRPCSWML